RCQERRKHCSGFNCCGRISAKPLKTAKKSLGPLPHRAEATVLEKSRCVCPVDFVACHRQVPFLSCGVQLPIGFKSALVCCVNRSQIVCITPINPPSHK